MQPAGRSEGRFQIGGQKNITRSAMRPSGLAVRPPHLGRRETSSSAIPLLQGPRIRQTACACEANAATCANAVERFRHRRTAAPGWRGPTTTTLSEGAATISAQEASGVDRRGARELVPPAHRRSSKAHHRFVGFRRGICDPVHRDKMSGKVQRTLFYRIARTARLCRISDGGHRGVEYSACFLLGR